MAVEPQTIALKARWVFPVAGVPIAGGVVTIRGDRIVDVDKVATEVAPLDLGNVAIVPGLVNAHTHLEFSDLAAPLGVPGASLPDWIRLVIAHRRAASGTAGSETASVALAVLHGLTESVANGVTALGEIATTDWRSLYRCGSTSMAVTMFHESIATTAQRIDGAFKKAADFVSASLPGTAIRPGLSPHAPYTVRIDLLANLLGLAQQFGVPMAMHLAESREELELIHSGKGKFRELLLESGASDQDTSDRFTSLQAYLELLSLAPRALVVHGNYLQASEIDFLAEQRSTMSVVYCPRTHAYFRHEPYPLARMLARGVALALGTDSRASNPDLNLLAEMRHVADHHPQISPAQILELGTLSGAQALGIDHQMGSLTAGKLANLAIIEIPDRAASDPHELLFDPAARVAQTWIAGRPAFSRQPP